MAARYKDVTAPELMAFMATHKAATFNWVVGKVRATRIGMHPAIFDYLTKPLRERVWEILWDRSPKECAMGMTGMTGLVIDFERVFNGGEDEDILHLRSVLKKKFNIGAEAVICKCANIDKVGEEEWEMVQMEIHAPDSVLESILNFG